MLVFLFAHIFAETDRRLDPFQFNLCVWDLEGIDPTFEDVTNSILTDPRELEEGQIASTMYSQLSTCDMFVLPGLRNHTTAKNLIKKMEEKEFSGFTAYPTSGRYDSTLLSRIDLENTTDFKPNEFEYPIPNSKCNFTGTGHAMMNMSFYGTLHFHDPTPLSHVFSVRLKTGNTPENCAFREAQADLICKKVKEIDSSNFIFVAGSFEASSDDPYYEVLTNCGLTDVKYLAKDPYTRVNKTSSEKLYYDTVFVNDAIKNDKRLDTLKIKNEAEVVLPSTSYYTYPLTLYTRLRLTKKWKTFEISYALCIFLADAGFFTWLMFFSRERKESDYQQIGE
ncbi:hypothetical protein GPJ56_003647 [Histomonas meleagridis]|uniref:uncharacterized protein n=1 Tax=Histomonas meleagridis TaxID=135588 RepID=UPI003559F1E7|nr:hypothetical protein GPJ56_003647 [Histomonas meleagridis]KAH0800718.1 hypothetical protein GO595_006471 [Histomonas meleagridis]